MKVTQHFISGLDIQKEYLTIAQYAPEERAVMLVAIQPIPADSKLSAEKRTTIELGALKNKFKLTHPAINCSLASEYAVIKKVPVDPGEQNLDEALAWELGQQVIGLADDYFFDFQECGLRPDGLREFLLVAYQHEKIDSLTAILKTHRLTPCVVDVDLFALVNVFEVNYPEQFDSRSVIVHAEGDVAKLIVIERGMYIDHELMSYPNGTDPQTFAGLLHEMAAKTLQYTRSSVLAAEVSLFVTGSLFGQEGYFDAAKKVLRNAELLDPFRKIGCRVGVDSEQLVAYITQLSVAVGLALRGND